MQQWRLSSPNDQHRRVTGQKTQKKLEGGLRLAILQESALQGKLIKAIKREVAAQ
jgi:hypothetical protein